MYMIHYQALFDQAIIAGVVWLTTTVYLGHINREHNPRWRFVLAYFLPAQTAHIEIPV